MKRVFSPSFFQSRISMVRKGYLQEAGNFADKTDDEILAHLKTSCGQEQLSAVQENSQRLRGEIWEQAIAAALKTQK
jgi:hypothetical protein